MKTLYIFLAILGLSNIAQGSNSETNADFINKMIEKRGIHGCKKVISNMFKGKSHNVRVNTSIRPGEKNAIKLIVTQGRKGDSMMTDIFLRKLNGKCIADTTLTVTFSGSCLACLNKMDGYKITGECADFTEFKHNKGAVMYMKSIGNSCIVTILNDFSSAAKT